MLRTLQNISSLDQSFQNTALAVISLVSIVLVVYELIRWSGRIRGFSGPMGLPVVGNLLQIQGKDAPEQYRVWSKTYGPVYQIALGSIPVLVINSAAAAKALFIQNSQACASRPEFYTFHKVSVPAQLNVARLKPCKDHFEYFRHHTWHLSLHRKPSETSESNGLRP